MCVERTKSVEMNVGGDHFRTDWLGDAELALNDIARQLPHDQVTVTVGLGDPAKMLCEEAERLQARAIVIGNRRVKGTTRILGSGWRPGRRYPQRPLRRFRRRHL